jgi:hypothetical protein
MGVCGARGVCATSRNENATIVNRAALTFHFTTPILALVPLYTENAWLTGLRKRAINSPNSCE